MLKTRSAFLFFLLIMLGCSLLYAEADKGKEKKEDLTIDADVAMLNPDGTREVRGHVKIRRGTMVITGDRAKFFEKDNLAEISGGVRAVDEDTILICGFLKVYLTEEKSVATINPKIVNITRNEKDNSITGKVILSGEKIEIYHKENHIRAIDNVFMDQKNLNRKKEEPKGSGEIDFNSGDLQLKCEVMDIFMDSQVHISKGNVVIAQGDMIAKAHRCEFYQKEEKIILSGNAKTFQNLKGKVFISSTNLNAESERAVYYSNNAKLHLFDKARTWQKDGFNEIHGQEIIYYSREKRTVVLKAEAKIFDDKADSENKERKKIIKGETSTDIEKIANDELKMLEQMEKDLEKKEEVLKNDMKAAKDEKGASKSTSAANNEGTADDSKTGDEGRSEGIGNPKENGKEAAVLTKEAKASEK